MKRRDEATPAEFINERGEFYGATLTAEWRAPERVELSQGVLTIRSRLAYWSRGTSGRVITPPRKLLDSFIALAADSAEIGTLADLVNPSPLSDQRVLAFANRYGGLQIFCGKGQRREWPVFEHLEYCEVWRYFAQVMGSLVRIGAEFYQGRSGSKEDWDNIHRVPPVMRETVHRSRPGPWHPFPEGDEENWLSLAHFAGKRSEQGRTTFRHLVNTLLGLGAVRPWFTWSEAARGVTRPELRYSSQSLLSQLVLQLCLRLAKLDSFLVCIHCHKPYSPVVRAPKAGQRNFCPDCRAEGIPKQYALKDFRHRQRQSSEGC